MWLLLVSTRVGTWLGSVPGASTMVDISGTDAGYSHLGQHNGKHLRGSLALCLVGTAGGAEVARVVSAMVDLEEIMGRGCDVRIGVKLMFPSLQLDPLGGEG